MRRWGVDDVVHVREGRPGDVARLARLASGHGYGLVLSGGGARGFAHLGVLRALAGDRCSSRRGRRVFDGSAIAGAIALDLHGEELLELVEQQFHRLLDYTVPVVSLIKGQRISRNIERHARRLGHRGPVVAVHVRVDQPHDVAAADPPAG